MSPALGLSLISASKNDNGRRHALKRGGGFDLNATSLQLLDDDISYVINTKQINSSCLMQKAANIDCTTFAPRPFPRSSCSSCAEIGSHRFPEDMAYDSTRPGDLETITDSQNRMPASQNSSPRLWYIERIVWLTLFEASRASIKCSSAIIFSPHSY
jgi:hypothetical protein